jgi:uncharacterized protein
VGQAVVFLSVGLVVVSLVHYYLWRRLVRDTTVPGRARRIGTWGLVGLAAVLIGALIGSRLLPHDLAVVFAWPGYLWLAVMFYLLVGLAILEIPGLAVKLRLRGQPEPAVQASRRLFLGRAVAVSAGVAAVGLVGAGVGSALGMPQLKRIQVPLARLPRSADGFRIALVSDIHLGPLNGVGRTARIVDMINGLDADLVAVVGDLVDGSVAELGPAAAPLARLRSRLGSFFVTGNHEYFSGYQEWIEEVTRLGMRPLRNARVELPAGLDIAGVNDATGGSYHDAPDVAKALSGRDPSRAVVLLAHQPIQAHDAAAHGVDLQLSGHTHGGQMWPFHYVVRAVQPSLAGLSTVGDTQLYVTRGAGFWGPPVRVGARPDITVLSLHVDG